MQNPGVAWSACTVAVSRNSSGIRQESRMQSDKWDAAVEVDYPDLR